MLENKDIDELKTKNEKLAKIFENLGPLMTATKRAKSVKQPRGGYIKRVDFDEISLGLGEEELNENENIHASLMGMAIDYLTRFQLTGDKVEAFKISLLGSDRIGELETATILLYGIKGLDDQSITNAIKISGYDVLYRTSGVGFIPIEEINPDQATIENVRIMVKRTLNFFEKYGPITKDTLWDLKVLKNHFTKNHSLQLFIYWRMGLKSDYESFKNIKYIGIYNPRKNKVFTYDLSKLPPEIIRIVDEEVIGYEES